MIQSGKLDRTITIGTPDKTVSPSGKKTMSWTSVATVRASLKQRTTKEFTQAFGEDNNAIAIFTMRYRPSIHTGCRVLFEGNTFGIKEIVEIGRKRGLELRCEAAQ